MSQEEPRSVVHIESRSAEKLAGLLLEIDAMIEMGDISVGVAGISPEAARLAKMFYGAFNNPTGTKEVWITDNGLRL